MTADPDRKELTLSGQSTVRRSAPPAAAKRRVLLTVAYSPDQSCVRRDVELPAELAVLPVGRDVGGPGLRARDPRMSRTHFRVVWDARDGVHRLGDAGSANGTFVNGGRVTSAPLSLGDVIRAGDTLFVYREDSLFQATVERALLAAPSDLTILVIGETGTGKEVLVRRIHEASGRAGPLIPVNCATIPPDLIAAELFGHTKGAFSGAFTSRPGLFRAADGGTLFLDEIADLPPEVQPALLRALQERKVRPVGSERELDVDARVVAATHTDLRAACDAGLFREDLCARLTQLTLRVPALRERKEQVLELLFELSQGRLKPSADAAEALLLWRWPHNVRELQSLARAFAVMRPNVSELELEFLREMKPEMLAERAPEELEAALPADDSRDRRTRLLAVLDKHEWNIAAVARELGKPRAQVYRWIKAYGLRRSKAE